MRRRLYVWRYLNRSTEYVDVIAYNEGTDPHQRLMERIPKAFEVLLERELAE